MESIRARLLFVGSEARLKEIRKMLNYTNSPAKLALIARTRFPRRITAALPAARPEDVAADLARMEAQLKKPAPAPALIAPALTVTVNESGASFFGPATPAPAAAPGPVLDTGFFAVEIAPVLAA